MNPSEICAIEANFCVDGVNLAAGQGSVGSPSFGLLPMLTETRQAILQSNTSTFALRLHFVIPEFDVNLISRSIKYQPGSKWGCLCIFRYAEVYSRIGYSFCDYHFQRDCPQ